MKGCHQSRGDPTAETMSSEAIEPSGEDGTPKEDELEPIEGLRAWIVVFGSFLMHAIVIGYLYSFSVLVQPYQDEFGASRTEASLVYTVSILMMFGGGLPAGRLADMFGTRILFCVGAVLWGLGALAASFATEFWHIVMGQGFLTGLGMACTYWPGVTVVPQWFDKRRAFALGVAVVGAGAGNFGFGVLIEALIASNDFRLALRVSAGIGTGVLALATICIKRRLPLEKGGGILGNKEVFKERLFYFILATAFFFQFGYHGPFVFLAAFARDNGIESSRAALAVGLLGIGSAVGRVGLGFAADYIGRVRTFQVTLFATAVCLAVWPVCTDAVSLGIFAFFFGFFSGGFIALVPVVTAEFYGAEKLGGTMGIISLALIPGSIGGPPLLGLLNDSTSSFLGSAIFSAVMVFLSGFCIMALPTDGEAYRLARQKAPEDV